MPFIGTHIIIHLREPIVRDADPVRCLPALVADLGMIGLRAAKKEIPAWMLLRLDMHLSPLLSPQLMVSLLVKLTLSRADAGGGGGGAGGPDPPPSNLYMNIINV